MVEIAVPSPPIRCESTTRLTEKTVFSVVISEMMALDLNHVPVEVVLPFASHRSQLLWHAARDLLEGMGVGGTSSVARPVPRRVRSGRESGPSNEGVVVVRTWILARSPWVSPPRGRTLPDASHRLYRPSRNLLHPRSPRDTGGWWWRCRVLPSGPRALFRFGHRRRFPFTRDGTRCHRNSRITPL